MSEKPARKKPKPPKRRDPGYTNILHHLTKHVGGIKKVLKALLVISLQLASIEKKLNELLQQSDPADEKKLRELAKQLDEASTSLESTVEQNQP